MELPLPERDADLCDGFSARFLSNVLQVNFVICANDSTMRAVQEFRTGKNTTPLNITEILFEDLVVRELDMQNQI